MSGMNQETEPTPTPQESSTQLIGPVESSKTPKPTRHSQHSPRNGKFQAVGALEKSVGGREALLDILEQAQRTASLEILLAVMADPARAHLSMPQLCKDAGMQPKELLRIFREASVAKAVNDAHLALAQKLTGVVNDVADKAANHLENCKCTLNGTVGAAEGCPECRGQGKVYFRGSLPHQQMVLESTGLLKRGGGVSVNVQQQVAVGGQGLFDRFVKATDAAAYGSRPIDVEATSVEEA